MADLLKIANEALKRAGRKPVDNLDYNVEVSTKSGRLYVYLICAFRIVCQDIEYPELIRTIRVTSIEKGRGNKYRYLLPAKCLKILKINNRRYNREIRYASFEYSSPDITITYLEDLEDYSKIEDETLISAVIDWLTQFIKTRLDDELIITD